MRASTRVLFLCLTASTACAPLLFAGHPIRNWVDLYPSGSQGCGGITYSRNVVYIASEGYNCVATTLQSVDVSDPYDLRVLDSAGAQDCKSFQVKVVDDVLYSASWGIAMRVWRVNNPGYFDWRWDYRASASSYCLEVANQRAFVGAADGYVPANDGVCIVDVSSLLPPDPAATLISKLSITRGSVGGIAVRGSYLYYGDGDYFVIADISNERQPVEVSRTLLNPQFVTAVVLRGDLAYVGCGRGTVTFFVYDISNPLSPQQVGQYVDVVETGNMFLMGDYAFIAGGGGGLVTVNISNPANPTPVTRTDVPLWPGTNNAWESAVTGNGRWVFLGAAENYPHTSTQDNYTRGALFSLEVFDHDVDDAGPGLWSQCSLGEASWNTQYEADSLPTAASPAWKVLEGTESWAGASGGVLRINDTGAGGNSDRIRWWRNWDATNTRGATILLRARCDSVQQNGTLNDLTVEDGCYVEDFAILPDRIRANRANLDYPLDGTQWHTYRITTQGSQFNVYVNESATPAMTGSLSAATRRARIIFGSGSGLSRQDISYDYLYAFSNGVYPPPAPQTNPTVNVSVSVADSMGKGSLSGINPPTARVFWSTDGGSTWSQSGGSPWDCQYEATAMPRASVPFWEILEGAETGVSVNGGILQIIDSSTASGSKIKWMRSWGAVPSIGTTVLARARCTAIGGDTTFLGNVFVEDGVHVEQFKIMTDRIVATNANLTYPLDGTAWHVYRVTTRDNQFKVYVDEAAAPVLAGTLATASSINRVVFGSGASAGTQTIEFDYLYYSSMGDQPPGQSAPSGSVGVMCTGQTGGDRGVIAASAIPINPSSGTANEIRFSLRDLAGNTGYSPVYHVRTAGPRVPDFDRDSDVDLEDFGHLQVCLSGPNALRPPGCEDADFDSDLDVDLDDLNHFADCLAGPNSPPGC